MKSVKEKAEELFDFPYIQDTFEDGANYVLEQIEKVLQGDLNSHSTFKLKCIKQIIEELKKQSYDKKR